MSDFQTYQHCGTAELRPYVPGESLRPIAVSVSDDPENDRGMIARNPDNPEEQWYVSREYFEKNYRPVPLPAPEPPPYDPDRPGRGASVPEPPVAATGGGRTLDVKDGKDARDRIADIQVIGDPDAWVVVAKASSKIEGWMKTTKAMRIGGGGLLVSSQTLQRSPAGVWVPSEALVFVPNACLVPHASIRGAWAISTS